MKKKLFKFLNLIHKIKGEVNPLKFGKIKIKGDKLPETTRSW